MKGYIYFRLYYSFIQNILHTIKKSSDIKKQDNGAHSQLKKKSIEVGTEMAQILNLTDKDFKIARRKVIKDIMKGNLLYLKI